MKKDEYKVGDTVLIDSALSFCPCIGLITRIEFGTFFFAVKEPSWILGGQYKGLTCKELREQRPDILRDEWNSVISNIQKSISHEEISLIKLKR